jgi:hypothetical protein
MGYSLNPLYKQSILAYGGEKNSPVQSVLGENYSDHLRV